MTHCSVLGIETQTVDVDKNCNFLRKWYEKITTFKITKFLTSDSRDNLAAEGSKLEVFNPVPVCKVTLSFALRI